MKINNWVGCWQLVYKQNDPARGEVWIFQRDPDLVCIEAKPDPNITEETLNQIANG